MELLRHIFTIEPLLALFATIALAYLVGKSKSAALSWAVLPEPCWSASSLDSLALI